MNSLAKSTNFVIVALLALVCLLLFLWSRDQRLVLEANLSEVRVMLKAAELEAQAMGAVLDSTLLEVQEARNRVQREKHANDSLRLMLSAQDSALDSRITTSLDSLAERLSGNVVALGYLEDVVNDYETRLMGMNLVVESLQDDVAARDRLIATLEENLVAFEKREASLEELVRTLREENAVLVDLAKPSKVDRLKQAAPWILLLVIAL